MKKIQFIIILIIASVTLLSWSPDVSSYSKKIGKLVYKNYAVKTYSKKIISTKNKPASLDGNFYILNSKAKKIGYLYLGSAPSKHKKFDYIVLFNSKKEILTINVLAYRESYGGEISSKRWLRQFIGKKSDEIEYGKKIDGISGATISAKSLTNQIQIISNCLPLLP